MPDQTATNNPTSGTLILLVGSNPLPNYLVACALRPERIALVYTSETEGAKDQLKSQLREALTLVSFIEPDPFIEDATCATTVKRTMNLLLDKCENDTVSLNYTGGTKVMAVHARTAFTKRCGEQAPSTYLDEGGRDAAPPRLRYDNGSLESLTDLNTPALRLETVLALHSITYNPSTALVDGPTEEDARSILCAVLNNPNLARTLYEERQRLEQLRRPSDACLEPFNPCEHGLNLSIEALPETGEMRRDLYRKWYKFIGGEWLEKWIGTTLRGLPLEPAPEIVVGVNASRGGDKAKFEVDVAAIRGYRSHFISCTTDMTKHICKSKLFEIAIRSRQLGGDLARAALVCLAEDGVVMELRKDIKDLWGATNTTKVFGLSDIREWSNFGGQPNTESLEEWMNS